jgi:hypothetical protein
VLEHRLDVRALDDRLIAEHFQEAAGAVTARRDERRTFEEIATPDGGRIVL